MADSPAASAPAATGADGAAADAGGVEAAREPETPREPAAARDWAPPTKEYAAFVQSLESAAAGARSQPPPPETQPAAPESQPADAGADINTGDEGEAVGVGAQAGAGEARGRVARVRDGTRARVGRMREEAIVVLEETPDDSGLRFVVAAVALFVVFLVLLFLSTTVLR